MRARYKVFLLGGLRVERQDGGDAPPMTRFRTQKTAALFAFLAYYRERTHLRETLADLLWPDARPEFGRNSLSVAFSSLRSQFEVPGEGPLFIADRETIRLIPEAVITDVTTFQNALDQAARTAATTEKISLLCTAVGEYSGDLLPGFYEEWALREQDRLRESYFDALRRLITLLERSDGTEQATLYARRLADADPGDDAAQQTAARLHGLLQKRVIASPSSPLPEIAPAIPAQPRIVIETVPIGYIPTTLTRFFGRERELDEIATMAADPETHLLTLTGPGGTGKTRLAIEAARRLLAVFAGAVWFVALAETTDGAQVISAIRAILGLPLAANATSDTILASVAAFLSQRPSVVILDNFEQIVDTGGAEAVAALLHRAPNLTCLVTSRRLLDIPGEREFPVPPLPVPETVVSGQWSVVGGEKSDPATVEASAEPSASPSPATDHRSLATLPSVALFVDRARAVRPDFQVTAANAETVAELCRRLEGMPLAIELAASRVNVMGATQLLAQLSRRLDFLVNRARGVAARHRTLRAAVDWSYRLLSPEAQRFFTRLSVFRGGWTAADAEAVCEERDTAGMTLDLLATLEEASLIVAEEQATDGTMRFRMLEMLREFAADELPTAERAGLCRCHLAHFRILAEELEPRLSTAESRQVLARWDAEMENFRIALDTARESAAEDRGAAEQGMALASALCQYWRIRGFVPEGRRGLEDMLANVPEAGRNTETATCAEVVLGFLLYRQGDFAAARTVLETATARARRIGAIALLARGLNVLGYVLDGQGDAVTARTMQEESLTLSETIGDEYLRINALNGLGIAAKALADFAAARRHYEEALRLARRRGDAERIATVLENLALVAMDQGELDEAYRLTAEGLAMRRTMGEKSGQANDLVVLGNIANDRGDRADATRLYEEAAQVSRQIGDRGTLGRALNNLGNLVCTEGDFARARALCEEGLAIRRETGEVGAIAYSLYNLAYIASELGDNDAAEAGFLEAFDLWYQQKALRASVYVLLSLAMVAVRRGEAERGAALLGATDSLRESLGILPTPEYQTTYEQTDRDARALLGGYGFRECLRGGSYLLAGGGIRLRHESPRGLAAVNSFAKSPAVRPLVRHF